MYWRIWNDRKCSIDRFKHWKCDCRARLCCSKRSASGNCSNSRNFDLFSPFAPQNQKKYEEIEGVNEKKTDERFCVCVCVYISENTMLSFKFEVGVESQSVPVTIVDDNLNEYPGEYFTLGLA